MRKIISAISILAVLIGFAISYGKAYADTGYDGFIKVRLTSPLKSDDKVKLYSERGFSLYCIDDLENELGFPEVNEIYVTSGEEGDIVFLDSNGELVYILTADAKLLLTSRGEDIRVKVEDRYYRGYLMFNAIGDKLIVINYLPLEEYLYGVLPKEMGFSFHIEALKAQGIAARTYAIKNFNKHIEEGYNLCDTSCCQAYGGMNVESSKTNEAVDDTKGMIITYNGYPIDAVYHSNSGGHTESAEEVWGGNLPYLKGIPDEFSKSYPNSRWQLKMNSKEIEDKLYNNSIDVGKVMDIIILDTTSNGRVKELMIVGDKGNETISGNEFRTIIGTTTLKSAFFTVSKEKIYDKEIKIYSVDNNGQIKTINLNDVNIIDGDGNIKSIDGFSSIITYRGVKNIDLETTPVTLNFTIDGKGYGHGVGMSQWGAQGMAVYGYSFEEILKYYYNGIDIEGVEG